MERQARRRKNGDEGEEVERRDQRERRLARERREVKLFNYGPGDSDLVKAGRNTGRYWDIPIFDSTGMADAAGLCYRQKDYGARVFAVRQRVEACFAKYDRY